MKLTKLGQTIFTIITIILDIVIYNLLAVFGVYGSNGIFYQIIIIGGWAWLLCGQFVVLCIICE